MSFFGLNFLKIIAVFSSIFIIIFLLIRSFISPKILYDWAMKEVDLDNYIKAKKLFLRAIKRKKNFTEALHRLGLLSFKLKDYKTSEDCFRKIIRFDSDNFVAHYNLGLSLQMLQKTDEAKDSYEKALEVVSDDYDTCFNMGIICFKDKNYKDALSYFEKAQRSLPNQTSNMFFIVKCKDELSLEQASITAQTILSEYSKLASKSDLPAEFYSSFARAYAKNGQIKEAEEYCRKSLSFNSEDNQAYKLLGLISLLNNDILSAKTNLTIASQLDPNDDEVYNILKYT